MEKEHECGCGCEDMDQEMTVDEMVQENNIVLNTLIDFLVEKKIIDEDEFIKKLNECETSIESEDDNDEDDDEDDENKD